MLIIVRHGRTEANAARELLGRRDLALDDVGIRQAEAIGAVMPTGARVVSSPLLRTRATAAAISDDIEIDERLIELDYGVLEGTRLDAVDPAVWIDWRADTAWRPEGGESLDDLAARVWPALEELAADAVRDDVVVVTHVSPIKAAVAWALGAGIEVQWRCFVQQASITRISTAGGRPSLTSFNETHHL